MLEHGGNHVSPVGPLLWMHTHRGRVVAAAGEAGLRGCDHLFRARRGRVVAAAGEAGLRRSRPSGGGC